MELSNKGHHMIVRNRNSMELTGISRIESVNPKEFVLETALGNMMIWGNELEIINLDVEKGNLNISGHVTAIEYDDHKLNNGKKQSFVSKLFK